MRSILALVVLAAALPTAALAQTDQEITGHYDLRANPPGAEPCIQTTASFRVNSVSGRTLNVTYGPVDGALAWDPGRRAFRGELGTSTFRVNLAGAFNREPDKVRVVMEQRVVGESCVSRLEGSRDAPLTAATTPPAPPLGPTPGAPPPATGDVPGMDPPAGTTPGEVVLFGQGETRLLLILSGVLFVTGFLFALLGGRRRKSKPKSEPFVQTPVMASPTPDPQPEAAPPPPVTPPAPPPAAAAPEPVEPATPSPAPAPPPGPEPEPEPIEEREVPAEPAVDVEPKPPAPALPKPRAKKAPARAPATGRAKAAKAAKGKTPAKPKPRKPAK